MDEKRFVRLLWLVKASLIAVLAYVGFGAIATRLHVDSVLEPRAVSGDEAMPNPPASLTRTERSQDYSEIVQRNLFSGGYPQTGLSRSQALDSLDSAEELGLKLSGTIAGGPAVSRAIIENSKDKSVNLYSIGDTVASATVESIQRDTVILRHQGRQLMLKRQAGTGSSGSMNARNDKAPPTAKTAVASAKAAPMPMPASPMEQILQKVRIEPYRQDKRTEGLMLSGLEGVPLAEKVGLKNGDVIQAINGQNLTSKQKAFQVFMKAKTQPRVDIQLLRDGKSKDLSLKL